MIYENWELGKTYAETTVAGKTVTFGLVEYQDAKNLIIKNHYSKKWNTQFGKLNIGIFHNSSLLGVAVFGRMMNPQSASKVITGGMNTILELNRLWISDDIGANAETKLLSVCFKYIKHNFKDVLAIQSFADGRLGCGTIYKAANFKYYGADESIFLEDVKTGEVYHKVPLENTKRPTGFTKLNLLFAQNRLKPLKVKTYRYIYVLNKSAHILLKEKPYPEYSKGFEYCTYKPTCNQMCKAVFILKNKGEDYQEIKKWLTENFSNEEILESWKNAEKYFEA